MRKFVFAVVLLLSVLFVIWRLAEVQAIVETLRRGDIGFIFLALLIETVWLINVGVSYLVIYKAIGIQESFNNLLPVAAAANFVNIVAPVAGMSGIALFLSEARRRRYSPGKAAIASALYVLFEYAALLCILAVGLTILFRRNDINVAELVASALLLLLAIAMAGLIYLGMRSAAQLGKVLSRLARILNWVLRPFIHRNYLSEKRAHEFAFEAAEGLRELNKEPQKLLLPFFLALSKQCLLIGVLLVCFLAFEVPFSAGTLIAGFSIGYLFVIISPTPNGLGVVEGALTLVLASMTVPISAAAVITLAYRGFTFWMPLLIGLIAFRSLGGAQTIQDKPQSENSL